MISCHHNNPLAGHFGIDKTKKLVGWKYYWPSLGKDVKIDVWGCDIYLVSKTICHKPYGDLQSMPLPTHQCKILSINFMTGLFLSFDWKSDNYDLILVIVDRLIKMMHYKLVKVTINAPRLAEVIIDTVVRHYSLPDSIISDRRAIFTSKFWSLLYYLPEVKRRLSTTFYPQTDG